MSIESTAVLAQSRFRFVINPLSRLVLVEIDQRNMPISLPALADQLYTP